MSILIGLLTAVHALVAIFMIVLVLMQKSKDQGVGAAFGGGVTETVFGAGTTTALVRMTIWCACIFLAGSLILSMLHSHRNRGGGKSLMEKVIESEPTAPASTVPAMPVPEGAIDIPATPAAPETSEAPAPAAPAAETATPPETPAAPAP